MLRRVSNFPFRYKNLLPSTINVNYSAVKCSTAAAQPTIPETSKKDQNIIHDEIQPGAIPAASASLGGRGTFVKSSSSEEVYEFFIRLVNGHRNVQSRAVLGKALTGVVTSGRYMEFVDLYFDQWWRQWTNMLEADTSVEDPTGRVMLALQVLNLGKINLRTNGQLGRCFQPKVFQFLQSKIQPLDFNSVQKKDLAWFFIGLGNLASTQYIFKDHLVDNEFVTKTLSAFNEASKNVKNENELFDLTHNLTSIVNSLPPLNAVLKKEDLEFVTKLHKSVFDNEKFVVVNEVGRETIEFYRKSQTLRNFANAFSEWQINPETFCPNIWSSWFAAAEGILKLNMATEYPAARRRNERTADEDFGINRRTLASEALMLCVSIAKTATRFNNSKKLLALKEIWMPVLHKNAFQATGESVITFSDAARNAQLHLQALAALESQTDKPILVDEALEVTLSRRIDANKEYMRRKSEPQRDAPVNVAPVQNRMDQPPYRAAPPPTGSYGGERNFSQRSNRDEYFEEEYDDRRGGGYGMEQRGGPPRQDDDRRASYEEFNYRY